MSQPMQVVIRALDVLAALGKAREGRTLQQLHEELEIPVGSMHRLLTTLIHASFARRSELNGRYFLGAAARALTSPPGQSIGAQLVTPPAELRTAAAESGETVFLTELIGDSAVCVSLVEAPHHALRLFVHIGQEMPLHAAASSRAILAYQPEDKVRDLLLGAGLPYFTEGTPRTVSQVLRHLKDVREQGYDVCDNELDNNVWAVAAPVRSPDGSIAASVTLAAADSRMREGEVRVQACETVVRAAASLSAHLGAAPDASP